MPNTCVVPGCDTGTKKCLKKCSVFKVSVNEMLRRMWEDAIPGISNLKSGQFVCERHFEEHQIVRKWVKRNSEGIVIAETQCNRVRLLEGAVPSKFKNEASDESWSSNGPIEPNSGTVPDVPGDEETTKNNLVCKEEYDGLIEPNSGTVPDVPGDEETTENNIVCKGEYDDFCTVQCDNFADKSVDLEPNISEDKTPEMKYISSNIAILGVKLFQAVIKFSTHPILPGKEMEVTLPNSWHAALSSCGKEEKLIISEVFIDSTNFTPVLKKSITMDSEKVMTYHVHGVLIKENPELPRVLNSPQMLSSIITKFQTLRVCDGLGDVNIDMAQVSTKALKDSLNVWRSKECSLIGPKKKCSFCVHLRTILRQKYSRAVKRGIRKRKTVLSNPLDQKKISRIKCERRLKNRKDLRLKLVTEKLRQKQDELTAVRDQLLKERCLTFNIPDAQKTRKSKSKKKLVNE